MRSWLPLIHPKLLITILLDGFCSRIVSEDYSMLSMRRLIDTITPSDCIWFWAYIGLGWVSVGWNMVTCGEVVTNVLPTGKRPSPPSLIHLDLFLTMDFDLYFIEHSLPHHLVGVWAWRITWRPEGGLRPLWTFYRVLYIKWGQLWVIV